MVSSRDANNQIKKNRIERQELENGFQQRQKYKNMYTKEIKEKQKR